MHFFDGKRIFLTERTHLRPFPYGLQKYFLDNRQLVQTRLTAYTHGVLSDLAAKALTSSSPPRKGP